MGDDNCRSIISEIKNAEDAIQLCFYRVETLEKKLKSRHLSIEEREQLESELDEVKKLLTTNESQLKHLQRENSKSFATAAILMFICFLVYGVYTILTNRN